MSYRVRRIKGKVKDVNFNPSRDDIKKAIEIFEKGGGIIEKVDTRFLVDEEMDFTFRYTVDKEWDEN